MPVGAVAVEVTVTVIVAQDDIPPHPSFAAKYVVFVAKDGVVKDAPVPTCVPPQLPVNHLVVASPPVAVSVVVVLEQILFVPVMPVGATAARVTRTVTVAQDEIPPHPSFAAKYVVLEAKDGVVKDAPVPTCVPPQLPVNHLVVASPPVAVSVVVVPEQI